MRRVVVLCLVAVLAAACSGGGGSDERGRRPRRRRRPTSTRWSLPRAGCSPRSRVLGRSWRAALSFALAVRRCVPPKAGSVPDMVGLLAAGPGLSVEVGARFTGALQLGYLLLKSWRPDV